MNLKLIDRIIIIHNIIPEYGTRNQIEIAMSIKDKIKLSDSENKVVVMTPVGNNQFETSFKSPEAMTDEQTFSFTNDEITYLKARVNWIDSQGMFSVSTMATYDKILATEDVSAENT